MSQILRDIKIGDGHNFLALSAEHTLIGVWRDYDTGSMFLTLTENTKQSDSEEGLVYRDIYIAHCGEVLPFSMSNVLGHDLLPGSGRFHTVTAFYLPAGKDKVLH